MIEQLDMHLFGSTASFSLVSAVLSLSRSLLAVGVLSAISYFAYYISPKSKQHVAFSAYVAITISTAFFMSRWSTNPSFLWTILCEFVPWRGSSGGTRCTIFRRVSANSPSARNEERTPPEPQGKKSKQSPGIEATPKNFSPTSQTREAVVDPLPEKLRNTLTLRFHNDTFYFVINTLVIFAIHSTTVFSSLQPYAEVKNDFQLKHRLANDIRLVHSIRGCESLRLPPASDTYPVEVSATSSL